MENKTLIIYDLNGTIIQQVTGFYKVPNGVPFVEVVIPNGKRVVSVNVETKEPILEDIPLTEVEILTDKISILTEKLESVTLANTRLQESTFKYMVTQNRLTLTSRYSADKVTFKVDYESLSVVNERVNELDHDLFKLIKDNVLVGKDNYNYDEMINMLDFYQSIGFIDWDMWDEIFVIMELNLIKPEETPEI